MQKFWMWVLALGLWTVHPLGAEIQSVTIRWVAGNCSAKCNSMIAQNFQKIPGVASINMNPTGGQMDLRWKPNVLMDFQPINAAFSLVGPSIEDFRVKVRGTIQRNGSQVYLRSIGDNTQFLLLGLPQAKPNQYVELNSYNPRNYPLNPGMLQQLSQAAAENRVTIIEGPILAPERSPPWMLIVQNLQFVQTAQEAAQQQQLIQQQQQQVQLQLQQQQQMQAQPAK